MNQDHYSSYLSNLDKVNSYIHNPDNGNRFFLIRILSNAFLPIKKFFNRILGDGKTYDEITARNVVQYYLTRSKDEEQNEDRDIKILRIYDRLKGLENATKSYTDTISTSSIDRLRNGPSLRLLYHIHGNRFGENSQLEGHNQSDTLDYLIDFMNQRQVQKPNPNLNIILNQLSKAKELADSKNYSESSRQHILKSIQNGERCLLPGGWKGIPSGHALCYEVIPDPIDKSKVTFRIYNLGEGIQNHKKGSVGNKKKFQPYTDWKGIDINKLCHDDFFRALGEIKENTHNKEGNQTKYSQADIYEGLRSILNPEEIDDKNPPSLLMTAQSAGICTMKSFLAFLRTRLEEESKEGCLEYKVLKCDMKVKSLYDVVTKPNAKTDASVSKLRLVEKSLQKVVKRIDDLFEKKLIDSAYIQKQLPSLKKVEEWVDEHHDIILPKTRTESPTFIGPKKLLLWTTSDSLQNQIKNQINQIQKPISVVTEKIKELSHKPAAQLLEGLKELKKIGAEAWEKGEDQALHTGLLYFFSNLSQDERYWEEATLQHSSETSKELIVLLGEVSHLFFKSCFTISNAEIIHAERVVLFQKVMFFQDQLAHHAYPGIQKRICFSSLHSHQPNGHYYRNFDPQNNINASLFSQHFDERAKDSKNSTTNFTENYWCASAKAVGTSSTINSAGNGLGICRLLKDMAPEIEEKLSKENENFKNLPVHQQDALIYASDYWPNWLKSMRDSHLSLLYMMCESVAKPTVLDRKNAFDFKFTIEKYNEHNTHVAISLEGITGEILKEYPELVKIRKNNHLRFAAMHGKFASPALQEICSEPNPPEYEKIVLAEHSKFKQLGISSEEYKELASLFVKQSHVTLKDTLAYFTKYPEKLKYKDYQIIFRFLFFKKSLLIDELKANPYFATMLGEFVKSNYTRFYEQNELQACVFLSQLSRYFSGFMPDQPEFKNPIIQLRTMLERIGLESEEKSIIYQELVASFAKTPSQSLTDKDLTDILAGTAHLNNHPVPSKWSDPSAQNEVNKVLHLHASALKNQISNSPDMGPLKDQAIPDDIKEHPSFRMLFPNATHATKFPGNYFSFQDGARETIVHLLVDELTVEQRLEDGTWVRFISPSIFRKNDNPLVSRYLLQEYTHWIPVNNPKAIFIRNKKTDVVEYEAAYDKGLINSIRRLLDGTILSENSHLLNHFEDPSFVHYWFHPNETLAQIELPRFGLSFKASGEKPLVLSCDQLEGFQLKLGAQAKQLGAFSHYLLLENVRGERKVILPKQQFLNVKEKEVLNPNFNIDRQLELEQGGPQQYLVYDIAVNGTLSPITTEGNLYLAEVLTIAQEYNSSSRYLRKYGEKLTTYSKQEKTILQQMCSLEFKSSVNGNKDRSTTGDYDANACALRSYAGYLLLKNGHSNLDKDYYDNDIAEAIAFNYQEYLNRFHNVTALKFKKDEEIFLIKFLHELSQKNNSKIKFKPSFYIRLQELNSQAARKLTFKESDQKEFGSNDILPISQVLNRFVPVPNDNLPHMLDKYTKLKLIPNIQLITRLGSNIKDRFISYVSLALTGSDQEKQWLRHGLAFLKSSSDKEEVALAYIFECILDNPKEFEFPRSFGDANSIQKWRTDFLKVVNTLCPYMIEKKPQNTIDVNLTPPNFKLDRPEPALAKIESDLKLASVETSIKGLFDSSLIPVAGKPENTKQFRAWLEGQIKATDKDPVLHKSYTQLLADLTIYETQPVAPTYELKQNAIETIAKELPIACDDTEKTLKKMHEDILKLANSVPSSATESMKAALQKLGGRRTLLTLDDLIVNFGTQNTAALQRWNPALGEKEIQALYSALGVYLQHATAQQQNKRVMKTVLAIQALQKKNSDPEEINDLVQQLAADMSAKHCYDLDQNPAYLTFEYYANILLRQKQVDKLADFMKTGEINPVMEMIMASGKTKVLLPLLGLLRAKDDTLSMLIVPESLYENASSETQRILQNAFSRNLRSLHFERNTTFTTNSLETILSDLKSIQENHECLIMTSKSVQCLILKFIEMTSKHFKGKKNITEWPEDLKLMREILIRISTFGYPIIDEADSILNVLHEVCFSMGDPCAPSDMQIQIVQEIYDLLYDENSPLKNIAKLESDPNPNPNAPALSEKIYEDKLKKPLVEAFAKRLLEMKFDSAQTNQSMALFAEKVRISKSQNLLIDYLSHSKDHTDASQKFFDDQIDEIQEILSLAGKELSDLLSHTLTRVSNEKYGLDGSNHLAIATPFAAANVPHHGSLFANQHITMNYTYQTYAKYGISREVLISEIDMLQQRAMSEMQENEKLGLEDTEAWKIFSSLKMDLNIPLFNFKPLQVDALTKHVNANMKTKLNFVRRVILPQMELSKEKISCSPHNLVALFRRVSGFTGTLWNGDSMHKMLKTNPEPGTTAKTLNILFNKSRDGIIKLAEGHTDLMIEQLEKQMADYDVIIDAGGYFKQGDNLEIARKIAIYKKKSVVFYNKRGEQMITNGKTETALAQSSLSESERITFLDQDHTTGADVPQKRNAKGVVTVGRNMLERDVRQGSWRLRGLDKLQKVVFGISDDVEAIMNQATSKTEDKEKQKDKNNQPASKTKRFDDICHFTLANQSKQQGQDNLKSLVGQLESIPQQILLKGLLKDELTVAECQKLFDLLGGFWIKPGVNSAAAQYGKIAKEQKSSNLADSEKLRYDKLLNELYEKTPFLEKADIKLDEQKAELAALISKMKPLLPTMVANSNLDDQQSVEREQQTRAEMETELQAQEQTQEGTIELGETRGVYLKDFDNLIDALSYKVVYMMGSEWLLPRVSLSKYMKQHPVLSSYAHAFEDLHTSINVLEWPKEMPYVSAAQLLGPHRTPLNYALVEDNGTCTILNQHDAGRHSNQKGLYNLVLGNCKSKTKPNRTVLKKLVKIKFLNGDSNYKKEELEVLEEWLKESGPEKMRKFYINHVLAGFPKKTEAYHNSVLQAVFRTLTNPVPET